MGKMLRKQAREAKRWKRRTPAEIRASGDAPTTAPKAERGKRLVGALDQLKGLERMVGYEKLRELHRRARAEKVRRLVHEGRAELEAEAAAQDQPRAAAP